MSGVGIIDADQVEQSGTLLSICYRIDGCRLRFERC